MAERNMWVFDSQVEDVDSYFERWEFRFRRERIDAEDQDQEKCNLFLSSCGPIMFSLLRTLAHPDGVDELTFGEIQDKLSSHLRRKTNMRLGRRKFAERKRKPNESFNDYAQALRQLALTCEFKDDYEDKLIDQFIFGLGDPAVAERLLDVTGTFEDVLGAAYKFQSTSTYANASMLPDSIQAIRSNKFKAPKTKRKAPKKEEGSSSKTSTAATTAATPAATKTGPTPGGKKILPCFGCGANHLRKDCPFYTAICHKCKGVGHIARVCKQKVSVNMLQSEDFSSHSVASNANVQPNTETLYSIRGFERGSAKSRPTVKMMVNSVPAVFELDTGAAVTVMGEPFYTKYLSHLPLFPNNALASATGERIPTLGETSVKVSYESDSYPLQTVQVPVVIAKGDFPNLMGLTWIRQFKLDWTSLLQNFQPPDPVHQVSSNSYPVWVSKFPNLTSPLNSSVQGFEVQVRLKENAEPRFLKHRAPPVPLVSAIEAELNRLEKEGIIEPVIQSAYATPIVAVPKKGGVVRLCGDYSATLNPQLEMAYYPTPQIDDLSQIQGSCFSVIDLKDAYLQLQVSPASQELLTWSTHKGLYKLKRLPFGLASVLELAPLLPSKY